jgi:hypothetical protein
MDRRILGTAVVLVAVVLAAWVLVERADLPENVKRRFRRFLAGALGLALLAMASLGAFLAAPWWIPAAAGVVLFTGAGGTRIAAEFLGVPGAGWIPGPGWWERWTRTDGGDAGGVDLCMVYGSDSPWCT